jgi:hypothetical protein
MAKKIKQENIIESLFLKGKVFTFQMRIWSGKKSIDWKEIGINGDAITNSKLVTSGSKFLVDPEKINKLQAYRAKANSIIRENSFSFSFGSFVPEEKVEKVENLLTELKEDFEKEIKKLSEGYLEERASIIAQWSKEAKNLSNKKDSPEIVFEIMGKIEKSFPLSVDDKFFFEFKKHSDINEIAEMFICETTESISEQLVEFIEKLHENFSEKDELHGKMINSMHEKLNNLKENISFLGNKTLENRIDQINKIVLLGKEIGNDAKIKESVKNALSLMKDNIENDMEKVKKESLNSITSFSRNIEM